MPQFFIQASSKQQRREGGWVLRGKTTYHGSVGWISTPLTRSERWKKCFLMSSLRGISVLSRDLRSVRSV